MPCAPPKLCAAPGCCCATWGRYCEQHAAVPRLPDDRASACKRGYDRRWQRLRKMILARDPICKECGRLPSTDADHIIPKREGGRDSMENLQGLCHGCHSIKTRSRQ